jgi:hypothetical protein
MAKLKNDKYQFEFEQMRALPIYGYICDWLDKTLDDWTYRVLMGTKDGFERHQGICMGIKTALDFLKNPLAEQYLRLADGGANKRGPVQDKPRIVPDAENIE